MWGLCIHVFAERFDLMIFFCVLLLNSFVYDNAYPAIDYVKHCHVLVVRSVFITVYVCELTHFYFHFIQVLIFPSDIFPIIK